MRWLSTFWRASSDTVGRLPFPLYPLSSHYEDLCLDFNLAAAEEAARDFDLLEISQLVFLAMLLNDAVKLGILRRWIIGIMELALKELCTFQAWLGRNRSDILWAHRPDIDCDEEEEEEDTESNNASPFLLMTATSRDLCPSFTLSEVEEEAAWDFDIPEMT
ncbi:LOW QUALITY PROTEIN: hypothetical protein Cgig2_015564 [Carnegiea gigantea]|uniref:Uncharacterized protein n=1 Tax=Carnegiea gigantea TaxID=171969 RepID=A0A9Q1QB09_9CARY|nr:LOW QUALITY PROTEIN: hypothetical protein Cgig2_015564 [Carnegiea gigantea]